MGRDNEGVSTASPECTKGSRPAPCCTRGGAATQADWIMLDSYIIDAIKRQERERQDGGRVRLELPLHRGPQPEEPIDDREDEADRGVIIIPLEPDLPLSEDDAA